MDEPYFSQVKSGEKTVEARLYKGSWMDMCVGDLITFHNGGRETRVIIREIVHVNDFIQLYDTAGHRLLPSVDSREEVLKVYRRIYSEEDEQLHGVIGLKIEIY